jgi:competence protein ComGC
MRGVVMINKIQIKNAYTIIEISVVIVIASILMIASFSSDQILSNVKTNNTKDKMKVIYNSLGNFLAQNQRLPCPASIILARGDVDYGKEVRASNDEGCAGTGIYNSSTSSDLVFGMVPIAELNLPPDFAEDGFTNKISYFINQKFTQNYLTSLDSGLTTPSFGTASSTNIFSIKSSASGTDIVLNNDAIIVLVSYGVNKLGGFSNLGIKNSSPTSARELQNETTNIVASSANFDNIFYVNSLEDDAFDDIVFFKTRNEFVDNFNLMSLIPCKGANITDADFTKNSLYFGAIIESNTSCNYGVESVKKAKRCSFYGIWQDLITACPQ